MSFYRYCFTGFVGFLFILAIHSPVQAWPFDSNHKRKDQKPAAVAKASQKTQTVPGTLQDKSPKRPVPAGNGPTTRNVSGTVPKLSVAGPDPEIIKIQKQINDIIKINESLKANYASQAAEIQKISEQARIHQKILRDLQTVRKPPAVNSDVYLNQEKVRLIRKETEKNQKFLKSLQTQNVSKTPQKT